MINLVKNAIKFTKSGKISIEAAFCVEKSLLLVKVVDTGVGIAKQD